MEDSWHCWKCLLWRSSFCVKLSADAAHYRNFVARDGFFLAGRAAVRFLLCCRGRHTGLLSKRRRASLRFAQDNGDDPARKADHYDHRKVPVLPMGDGHRARALLYFARRPDVLRLCVEPPSYRSADPSLFPHFVRPHGTKAWSSYIPPFLISAFKSHRCFRICKISYAKLAHAFKHHDAQRTLGRD